MTSSSESTAPVALVTGAAAGFGLLTSIELARAGHRVFASVRNLGRTDRLDAAAKEAGVQIEKLRLDVTDLQSIDVAVAEIAQRAGRIDVLVNNAGFAMGGFLEDLTLDELREQFDTNFFGLVAVTKAVVPIMRRNRSGRVINLSSIAGRFAAPGLSAYCSSKWAVEGFSESLRHEQRPHGIWVSLIEPGTFKTEIFERNRRIAKASFDPSSPNFARTKKMLHFVEQLAASSTADPLDVARTIVHVATVRRPKLRYLVGNDAVGRALAKATLPFGWIESVVDRYLGVDPEAR